MQVALLVLVCESEHPLAEIYYTKIVHGNDQRSSICITGDIYHPPCISFNTSIIPSTGDQAVE
jgi:hypothetical protein